jgi:light-regulated signal transduction histidine kinase (bacteriophytochrome)
VLVCPKRLNCYAHKSKDTVVFIGLGDPSRSDLPNSFSRNKPYLVSPEQVRRWIERLGEAVRRAQLVMTEETERSIQGLHNIQPAVNIVMRAVERSINSQVGRDFEERLAACAQHQRDMYYAADLLTWMIAIQHDLVRPQTIDHGTRTPQPVYEMLDRFVRSFRLLAGQTKRVKLEGASYRRPRCYESIATLFFTLLHNAVKYSVHNQDITVKVNDAGNCVEVAVESFGPAIHVDEVELLFRPGERGREAVRFTSEGSGRGLFVAKMIAEKHGTYIECTPSLRTIDYDGIPCALNVFTIRLY